MGGSAIGGDLAAAALGDRATRPITTVRGYALESWTGPDSLVLCASYSGNTEETLACFEAAGRGRRRPRGAHHGRQAGRARARRGRAGDRRAGRDAAARGGRLHGRRGARVRRALRRGAGRARGDRHRGGAARTLVGEWGPEAADDSTAKALARALHGTLPVIHGAGPDGRRGAALEDPDQRERRGRGLLVRAAGGRPQRDLRLGARTRRGAAVARLPRGRRPAPAHPAPHRADRGRSWSAPERRRCASRRGARRRLERVLSLVLLGDLVSVYLAVSTASTPRPSRRSSASRTSSPSRNRAGGPTLTQSW